MQLTGIRQKVFLDRYSLKDKTGNPTEQTPDEMWRRVAHYVASIEEKDKQTVWEEKFVAAMRDFQYVPGGRILSGAGTGYDVSFYNCFVIPSPQDSRGGILETLKQMVEIMASGGGVGINLSSLRPRGSRVRKVNGFSSGPCNWAELFSVATKDIIQQGGTRRGALMLMLWDWHPDVEEFITVKQDLSRINGANLSVCVSDSFMEAVDKDEQWPLVFPDTTDPEYDTYWDGDMVEWKKRGGKVKIHKLIRARALWDLIAEAAWRSAEPGAVFMERCNKYYNNWYWNRVNCVNPCGEEPLPAWGVCNLGSINLSSLVVDSANPDEPGTFNFERLAELVAVAVRFQDNVVDLDPYIFEGIRKTQLNGERRIGLGTMGLGDTLIKLHLRYGSDEALPFIDKVYKLIRDEAYKASVEIAKEKGSFGKFNKKLYPQGAFIQELPKDLQEAITTHGIRNSLLLMQAPTGTTSLLANTTSGIEPVYEFEFIRRDRLGKHIMRHHLYDAWYEKHKAEVDSKQLARPDWFVSANDLTPEDHIKVQAVVQKYVDASISKTVNAPNNHTVEDVKKLYNLAYKLGCKGVTYMREGSRPGVLERKEEKKEEKQVVNLPEVKPRPMIVQGATYQIQTPVGKAYITVNTNGNNEPLELFINVGKAGSDVSAMAEGLGRMVSLILRFNTHLSPRERVRQVIAELAGIGGSRSFGFGKNRVRSLPDAVAKALLIHFEEKGKEKKQIVVANGHAEVSNGHSNGEAAKELLEQVVQQEAATGQPAQLTMPQSKLADLCPDCGEFALAYEEGCKKCYSCGYSEC
ncbi:adenosylcobalamin-dependent ribonucleoside-diphosphate reductase [Candidatus Roizmanbacteria bacterium]|nr:adenosylcobalamin-dependent ribonucleoside-diphosphate reductase [Candidatus Roizmanbacteria bacterium]